MSIKNISSSLTDTHRHTYFFAALKRSPWLDVASCWGNRCKAGNSPNTDSCHRGDESSGVATAANDLLKSQLFASRDSNKRRPAESNPFDDLSSCCSRVAQPLMVPLLLDPPFYWMNPLQQGGQPKKKRNRRRDLRVHRLGWQSSLTLAFSLKDTKTACLLMP